MEFLHVMIRVKDVEEAVKFYTELFDMNVVKKKRLNDCFLYFLTDKNGKIEIELTYNDETPKEGYDLGTGFGHFAFSVDSLKEFDKKLKSLGYDYLYKPYTLEGSTSVIAFVKDPDGYEIEVIEKNGAANFTPSDY